MGYYLSLNTYKYIKHKRYVQWINITDIKIFNYKKNKNNKNNNIYFVRNPQGLPNFPNKI